MGIPRLFSREEIEFVALTSLRVMVISAREPGMLMYVCIVNLNLCSTYLTKNRVKEAMDPRHGLVIMS
jgi:hypothetical protein